MSVAQHHHHHHQQHCPCTLSPACRAAVHSTACQQHPWVLVNVQQCRHLASRWAFDTYTCLLQAPGCHTRPPVQGHMCLPGHTSLPPVPAPTYSSVLLALLAEQHVAGAHLTTPLPHLEHFSQLPLVCTHPPSLPPAPWPALQYAVCLPRPGRLQRTAPNSSQTCLSG
jgi:hypothetical protein